MSSRPYCWIERWNEPEVSDLLLNELDAAIRARGGEMTLERMSIPATYRALILTPQSTTHKLFIVGHDGGVIGVNPINPTIPSWVSDWTWEFPLCDEEWANKAAAVFMEYKYE